MALTYFKRFRMVIDPRQAAPVPELPPGFFWVPWSEDLLDVHAQVHHEAFRDEIDAYLFPSFMHLAACRRLIQDIRNKPGFLPDATWIVACAEQSCGTIQSICDEDGRGSIQNVGVVPAYRQRGLGKALVLKALEAFRLRGLTEAVLEVTAENEPAVQLYQRLGFRTKKILFKLGGL
ncbi:MAG: GNAT family N-acetyltransferase [Gemmataceae bacterium]